MEWRNDPIEKYRSSKVHDNDDDDDDVGISILVTTSYIASADECESLPTVKVKAIPPPSQI